MRSRYYVWYPSKLLAMRKDRSCRPSPGRTYLSIGQDLLSVHEYRLSIYNASLHHDFPNKQGKKSKSIHGHEPQATMVYTDIQTLRGLSSPVDYGSGVEFADGLATDFPNSGIQLGLWLNGTQGCMNIISGKLYDNVKALFHFLVRDLSTPKVFLRIGYEFDNPSFGYDDPNVYKLAYQSLVNTCQSLYQSSCHKKIAFVWHSWGAPKNFKLSKFYPGDRYVDWIGVSIFQQVYPWANELLQKDENHTFPEIFAGGSLSDVRNVLDFARQKQKPIMIAESTPFFGMYLEEQNPTILQRYQLGSRESVDIWKIWFEPVLDLIEEYDIGMWSYISTDWNAQPMWNGTGFGDTRLSSSMSVMKHWVDLLGSPRFDSSGLECPTKHRHRSSKIHSDRDSKEAVLYSSSLVDGLRLRTETVLRSGYELFALATVLALLAQRVRTSRQSYYQQIQ